MSISLKWIIQAWHAIILAVVLTALGIGFYYIERNHRLNELDTTLHKAIPLITHAARVEMGLTPAPGGRARRATPTTEIEPVEGWTIEETLGIRHSTESEDFNTGNRIVSLEQKLARYGFYTIVWGRRSGEVIYKTSQAPEIKLPDPPIGASLSRFHGRYREMLDSNPTLCVLVGFDLHMVYKDLDVLKWQIAGLNFAIFTGCVLIGGWVVSGSLKPLEVIQRTAASIARGHLGDRIPSSAGGGAKELVQLSNDLNHTFAQMENLFQRQIRFTADASHELRTPLTALIGHIKYGRDPKRTKEELNEVLETCERSSHRIKRITEDLLELSHYDSGRFQLEREELPLDQLVAGLAEDLQPIAAKNGSSLQTDLRRVTASCDPFRLEQVISNLVNNALHHNPQPIIITLRTAAEPGHARIDVIDNGKGIQPENLAKLFDRFFQESGSRAKSRRNLNIGLGLSISRAIIEAHGGSLSVTSTPGRETTFTIRLPEDTGHGSVTP